MKWFRLYHKMLDDREIQSLPDWVFKLWVNILCLASMEDPRGTIPGLDQLAFRLRMRRDSLAKGLQMLSDLGLIVDAETGEKIMLRSYYDEKTNRRMNVTRFLHLQKESDSSAPRVAKYRSTRGKQATPEDESNVTGNVTVTADVTPLELDIDTVTTVSSNSTPSVTSHDATEGVRPPKKSRSKERTERPRNPMVDAVMSAWRPAWDPDDPKGTQGGYSPTDTEWGTCGRCAAELARAGATPEAVAGARRAWNESPRWKELTFTPDALKKHWGELQGAGIPAGGMKGSMNGAAHFPNPTDVTRLAALSPARGRQTG